MRGEGRYQVGEPFFYFDVVAEINKKGVFEKVVIVDRKETLKTTRPFLFML